MPPSRTIHTLAAIATVSFGGAPTSSAAKQYGLFADHDLRKRRKAERQRKAGRAKR